MSTWNKEKLSNLIVELRDGVAWITLDRPEFANAFADEMIVDLCRVLREADWDERVRAIVISGNGKSFCAGGDIKAMEEKTGMFAGEPEQLRRRYSQGIQQIPLTMESLQTPVLAMVNGPAIGAGCDFACMCDIRIGCQYSRFGETFVRLALVPGDGGAFFLQRVVGFAKAMELSLTGRIVSPEEALEIGLLNQLVDYDDLKATTEMMVESIIANSPVALAMVKKAIRNARNAEIHGHLDLVAAFQGITQRTADHFEGVRALKEKRPPQFRGS